MDVMQVVKLACDTCRIVVEFRGQSLETIQRSGWLLPPVHAKRGEGQEMCPNCAAKEESDTVSEVAELKDRIEKLQNTVNSIGKERRVLRDTMQDILYKTTHALG